MRAGVTVEAGPGAPARRRDALAPLLAAPFGIAGPLVLWPALVLHLALELKRPYHDGTTHLLFPPLTFIERLAALVPRPHKNLIIYSGVLAPNAKLRSQVVAASMPHAAVMDGIANQ